MRIGEYETHPASELFELMEGADFAELVEDIGENGLLQSVVLYQGQILDGRNRLRACYEACVKPEFRDYEGNDPIGFVWSLNNQRRHSTKAARVLSAAKYADMKHGGDRGNQHTGGKLSTGHVATEEAARLADVSVPTINRAKVINKRGAPELIDAVKREDVKVSAAALVARLPHDEQRELVASGRKAVVQRAAEIRAQQDHALAPAKGRRKDHPIGRVTSQVQDLANDLVSFVSQKEFFFIGAAHEEIEQCRASIHALQSAAVKTLKHLEKVA